MSIKFKYQINKLRDHPIREKFKLWDFVILEQDKQNLRKGQLPTIDGCQISISASPQVSLDNHVPYRIYLKGSDTSNSFQFWDTEEACQRVHEILEKFRLNFCKQSGSHRHPLTSIFLPDKPSKSKEAARAENENKEKFELESEPSEPAEWVKLNLPTTDEDDEIAW